MVTHPTPETPKPLLDFTEAYNRIIGQPLADVLNATAPLFKLAAEIGLIAALPAARIITGFRAAGAGTAAAAIAGGAAAREIRAMSEAAILAMGVGTLSMFIAEEAAQAASFPIWLLLREGKIAEARTQIAKARETIVIMDGIIDTLGHLNPLVRPAFIAFSDAQKHALDAFETMTQERRIERKLAPGVYDFRR